MLKKFDDGIGKFILIVLLLVPASIATLGLIWSIQNPDHSPLRPDSSYWIQAIGATYAIIAAVGTIHVQNQDRRRNTNKISQVFYSRLEYIAPIVLQSMEVREHDDLIRHRPIVEEVLRIGRLVSLESIPLHAVEPTIRLCAAANEMLTVIDRFEKSLPTSHERLTLAMRDLSTRISQEVNLARGAAETHDF